MLRRSDTAARNRANSAPLQYSSEHIGRTLEGIVPRSEPNVNTGQMVGQFREVQLFDRQRGAEVWSQCLDSPGCFLLFGKCLQYIEVMITLTEELLLLTLEDEGGHFVRLPDQSLAYALAGAVLMDLALKKRVDSDATKLFVVNPEPVGLSFLDPRLEELVNEKSELNAKAWVVRFADHSQQIRTEAIAKLCERGVLCQKEERVLWAFKRRAYPIVDDHEIREAKLRIVNLLMGDEIPDPHDAMLIGLAKASCLLPRILSSAECERVVPRLEQISHVDLISQATLKVIAEMHENISIASAEMGVHPFG